MPLPPEIASVPWGDPVALRHLIEGTPGSVTPLMLERLFEHHGLECICDAPTQGSVRAAVWAPKDRLQLREGASFTFVVYHREILEEEHVVRALNLLRLLGRVRLTV